MEALEVPVNGELDERSSWSDNPPVKFEEQELDQAAFKLWRQASRAGVAAGEES
jgi:hypothetical protein